ncbi:MAG: glycosyltransferase family 39 protein [Ignavibacteriales bacterium]|nr:glycosyltransferase family 39 protein [Ignavibacteriales bacterium]
MIRRTLVVIGHALCVLCGIVLYALLAPQNSPGQPAHFTRTGVNGALVFRVDIPFVSSPLLIGDTWLFLAVGASAFLCLLFVYLQKKRAGDSRTLTHKPFTAIVAFAVFILTLIPSEFYFVSSASIVALGLLLNLLAFFLLWCGLAPMVRRFLTMESTEEFLGASYRGLRDRFLQSPAVIIVGLMAGIHFLLSNWISLSVFDGVPHVQDSIAQFFQAKIFASGYLTAPAPPHPEFFEFLQIIIRDRWYSMYPPGHSLLLTVGVIAGIPWIVNPLFGTLTVVMLYLLGRELYGETVGRLSALLGLCSPFLVFMSSEYMNHTPALFFFLLFLLFFARAFRTKRTRDGMLSGAALGMLCLIRPYSAAALALPFLVAGFLWLRRDLASLWRPSSAFVVSFAGFIVLLLLYNELTNGHPFVFGFQVRWGEQVNPGFGEVNAGQSHTPWRGFLQTLNNLIGLNKYLFEWPIPSLVFVLLLFFGNRKSPWDILCVGALGSVAFAYFFYWFQDWCFGPRFLFEAGGLMILLTARGIEQLPSFFRESAFSARRIRMVSFATVAVLFLSGHAFNIPPHIRFYQNNYWGVDGEMAETAKKINDEKALVFVSSSYESVFFLNNPFLHGVVYARDRGEENQRLIDRFPNVPVYRIDRHGFSRTSFEH